ncbi:hypothetical protein ACVWZ6_002652 [Bradyrhizobium sp. GM6.1]
MAQAARRQLEPLLAESLRVAHRSILRAAEGHHLRDRCQAAARGHQGAQPTVASKHAVRLRQSYLRIAKTAAMMAGRYAHAKQFKRHQRQLRILRSRLGRIIRDIRRKIEGQAVLENAFTLSLGRPCRSARSSSASAAGSSIPSTPRRWSASARAKQPPLRVRCQSLYRHQQPPCSRWPVHAARQGAIVATVRRAIVAIDRKRGAEALQIVCAQSCERR